MYISKYVSNNNNNNKPNNNNRLVFLEGLQVFVREIGNEFLNVVNIDFRLQRKASVYKYTAITSRVQNHFSNSCI